MASGDKFCWSCGSALFGNDKFCRECGVDLEQREPLAEETQGKPTPPKEQKPRTSKTTPGVVADVPKISIDFLGAIKLGFQHWDDFDGRASRPEFWWWYLFSLMTSAAVGLIDGLVSMGLSVSGIIFLLNVLVLLSPTIAVTIRRLRDANYSPWWFLIPIVALILCTRESAVLSPIEESQKKIQELSRASDRAPMVMGFLIVVGIPLAIVIALGVMGVD